MQGSSDILEGFVDIHIHAGPSLMAREIDAWDMAIEAVRQKYAAIVIKDHHVPTVAATKIIQDHLPDKNLRIFGGMALNSSVGGLNAKAVEVAIGFGAKVIWMPTVSCKNHMEKHAAQGLKFPKVKQALTVPEVPLRCIDTAGNLVPEAEAVLDVIARHPEVVLATGHGDRDEADAMIRTASRLGIHRIVVNHPNYMVDATLDDMKNWCSLGATIEFTAVVSVPSSKFYCKPIEEVVALINSLDSERVILSSDYGQAGNGNPADGMRAFIELLMAKGIPDKAIQQMTRKNPTRLLGL